MTSTSSSPSGLTADVWRLSFVQTLFFTAVNVNIINTSLVGTHLAPAPWMATLPLSFQFLAAMFTSLPASLAMGRFGRRPVFITGVLISILSTTIQAVAIFQASFVLFMAASVSLGLAQGIAQFYRYAAADSVAPDVKPRAISMVLLGGLGAALLGPEISIRTAAYFPQAPYAGCYIAVALVQLINLIVLSRLQIGAPRREVYKGRSFAEFGRHPLFVGGLVAAALGYALMSFVMTATPLQIVTVSQLGDASNARIIQWHVIAMFAPSFVTGHIIRKIGYAPTILAGIILFAFSIGVGLSGDNYTTYFSALILLGVGWNLLFVSGSSLIALVAKPQERARIQGIADFLITFCVALASFSAGFIHSVAGWALLLYIGVIPLALICLMMIMVGRKLPPASS